MKSVLALECICGCGERATTAKGTARGHFPRRPASRITDKSIVRLSPEDEDLRTGRWIMNNRGYAFAGIAVHRLVMQRVLGRKVVPGEQVDHKNEDKLDCRRENLRLCTKAENLQNATKPLSRKKSGLPRGVYHDHYGRPGWYYAQTTTRKPGGGKHSKSKLVFLGSYPSLEQAVAAFDRYKRTMTAYVPPEERPA